MHRLRTLLASFTATALIGLGASSLASAEPPRPGCGYGDENHAHQAAPGQDEQNLRPGNGRGDENHPHTAPPGQAGENAGDQSSPRRGCKDDPRG